MTSANVTIFKIKKDGQVIAKHSQHDYCKTHWEDLLKYQPLSDYTILRTWVDEDEEYHEYEEIPLSKFMQRIEDEKERLRIFRRNYMTLKFYELPH